MIKLPEPAKRPTMYFVGVTTGQSSIMKMFPIWAKELGLDAIHDTVHEMARPRRGLPGGGAVLPG